MGDVKLREWWATRRHGPLTRERCEVCGTQLRRKQVVEVLALDDFHDDPMGGGFAAAYYCTTDAPQEAA